MICSSIHKKKLLFSLHGMELKDLELSIQPNKRAELYNSAIITASPCGTIRYNLLSVWAAYICFSFTCYLVLDVVQDTDYGINWLFSSPGSTSYCAFSCCHYCHGWTVCQGWQHIQALRDTSLKWLQMHVSTFPFPEFILLVLNQYSPFSLSFFSDQIMLRDPGLLISFRLWKAAKWIKALTAFLTIPLNLNLNCGVAALED